MGEVQLDEEDEGKPPTFDWEIVALDIEDTRCDHRASG